MISWDEINKQIAIYIKEEKVNDIVDFVLKICSPKIIPAPKFNTIKFFNLKQFTISVNQGDDLYIIDVNILNAVELFGKFIIKLENAQYINLTTINKHDNWIDLMPKFAIKENNEYTLYTDFYDKLWSLYNFKIQSTERLKTLINNNFKTEEEIRHTEEVKHRKTAQYLTGAIAAISILANIILVIIQLKLYTNHRKVTIKNIKDFKTDKIIIQLDKLDRELLKKLIIQKKK